MSLQHVSTLKRLSTGCTSDTFQQQGQQNESPDVKFNLICGVECEFIKCTPWRWHFNVWNTLEWCIGLIKWWP